MNRLTCKLEGEPLVSRAGKGGLCKAGSRRKAIVLILALWVVFFLAALSVAIGSHVSSVFSAAERLSARVRARAAASAGAAQTAAVIMANETNGWDGVAEKAWNRDETLFGEIPLADGGLFSVVFTMPDAEGSVVTNIGVIGEEGKINLNSAPINLLTALFVTVGGLGDADALALALAVDVWRTGSDEPLTANTKSGYSPQTMDNIEALLQIEEVSAALFTRLSPFITVYGSGLVNINAAEPRVLKALATADAPAGSGVVVDSLVQKLVGFREAGLAFEKAASFADMESALEQFPPLTGDEKNVFKKMVGKATVKSTAFGGTAYGGTPSAGEAAVQVDFVWDRQARRFVMWRER